MESTTLGRPPGCVIRNGQIFRVSMEHKNDREVEVLHPVATTMKEARERGADFFHPRLGWLIGGRKVANLHLLPVPVEESTFSSADEAFRLPEEGEGEGDGGREGE
jgi:hypothetical protein